MLESEIRDKDILIEKLCNNIKKIFSDLCYDIVTNLVIFFLNPSFSK